MLDFSIIVTSYNCSEYIESCLYSILNQMNVSLELICVDDCSEDDSLELINKISDTDKRVTVLSNKRNLGPASSRNIGIRASKGEYLCFVDGDDLLEDNVLYEMKKKMMEYSLDILSYAGNPFTEESFEINKTEYFLSDNYSKVYKGLELLRDLMNGGDRVRNCVFNCLKREFVDKETIFFPEGLRYADDNMFRFLVKANRVMYTNDLYYKRRYRSGSTVTSSKTVVHLESFIKSYIDDIKCYDSFGEEVVPFEDAFEKYLNKKYIEVLSLIERINPNEIEVYSPKGVVGYFFRYFIQKKCFFDYLLSEDDKRRIIEKDRVYIYGAKNNAISIAELIESWGINEYRFVITEKPCSDRLNGKIIESFQDVIKREKDECESSIFIIATSKMFHAEIESLLLENHLLYCKINN